MSGRCEALANGARNKPSTHENRQFDVRPRCKGRGALCGETERTFVGDLLAGAAFRNWHPVPPPRSVRCKRAWLLCRSEWYGSCLSFDASAGRICFCENS